MRRGNAPRFIKKFQACIIKTAKVYKKNQAMRWLHNYEKY
jgi:hypothetical protein